MVPQAGPRRTGAARCTACSRTSAIRERTKGKKSLDDALRGIQGAGGDVTETWPIERVLDAGDKATGVPVLCELYAKWKDGPIAVDLPDLFKRTGRVELGRPRREDHVRRRGAARVGAQGDRDGEVTG